MKWAVTLILVLSQTLVRAGSIAVVVSTNATARVEFGAEKLTAALNSVKLDAAIVHSENLSGQTIYLNQPHDPSIGREGFRFSLTQNNDLVISSSDDSGALYGCLELAGRIGAEKKLPTVEIANFHDLPTMRLRGTCIGLQKSYLLPGRHVYEYPITPELFPWFYDKTMWTNYLDFLAANRMNTLYLWAGHPFASLVKLKDYPYAVEVPDDVFRKNQEMYRWLATECDRRGIWLVQMFYNILVSKPFAETNHLSTQLSTPTPLVSDYTRKSIAEFVKEFPNVGFLVCLGEALRGTANQVEWCTNVILPGVLDGMQAAHLTEEPPIIIRTHAMDPYAVMPAAFQIYSNLFTETKYNGESLTTWQPRGKDQAVQLAMARLGPHLVNVHILSNLEPFRYGDVEFIKKCVQASRDRLGASGIHLYPLSYWNWPYSPDIAAPQELQWQRDWIWFEAWARYAWNPDIPEREDHAFWISELAKYYGDTNAAEKILAAYDAAGEVAPRLIRRFGITEGNRQTLSLGMSLDELVNPAKYGAIDDLWLSQSPPGERLDEFVEKEWDHKPHAGETPDTIIADVLAESSNAVAAADAAERLITKNRAEFERLRNDTHCIQAMAENYSDKVRAAELVLRYQYSHEIADLEQAQKFLAASLMDYRYLAELTKTTYHYANSMQTSQRKIPVPGGIGGKPANYLWSQLVPLYQRELMDFQARIADLKEGPKVIDESKIKPWPPSVFKLISTNAETYKVEIGAKVFTDRDFAIEKLAQELKGLTGIRFSHDAAKKGHYQSVEIEVSGPIRVLVGYFNSNQKAWRQPPQLETDASADDRGGVETLIQNAATIANCPTVDVHAFSYDAGRQKLEFPGKGSFVILGIVPQSVKLQ
jgi:hypothetical protein